MKTESNVTFTQARHCRLCLHVGRRAFYFGEGRREVTTLAEVEGYNVLNGAGRAYPWPPRLKTTSKDITGFRLELCTPRKWFRLTMPKRLAVRPLKPRLHQTELFPEPAKP